MLFSEILFLVILESRVKKLCTAHVGSYPTAYHNKSLSRMKNMFNGILINALLEKKN